MAAVFGKIEDIAVGEPGELRRQLVAFAGGRPHAHGETVVDNPGDFAFDPADVVEIGDDPVTDVADARRQHGQPTLGTC